MAIILFGAFLGVIFLGAAGVGWFTGALAGALGGCIVLLLSLQRQVAALSARLESRPATAQPPVRHLEVAPEPRRAPADDVLPSPEPAAPALPVEPPRPRAPAPAAMPAARRQVPHRNAPAAADPALVPPFLEPALRFFTTGNVVARAGSVVLFFGLAFLLKYAADRNIVPIQLRLLGVLAGGVALLALGWRLRRRGVYGAVLQGTGVGTLYLTTYVALHPYALIPPAVAFLGMVVVVVLAGWLSVMQESRPLATLGALGGFLAPILTSTGDGSHVVLFSYYALLNVGILGVAWRRAWRELNLLGFVFTFVIASIWGYRAYQPHYYATTQPFLAFHWALYLAVAVLFASRRRKGGIGYVDGALVFGVPTAGFALQAAITADFEQGLTLSAVVVAAVYLGLARALRTRGGEAMASLHQAFTALAVVFATLAIPLALDGAWLAGAWALEGAALLWMGARQKEHLPRAAGLALQLAAGVVVGQLAGSTGTAILNGRFVSLAMVGLAGLFSAYFLSRREGDEKGSIWEIAAPLALAWGLFWWLSAGIGEILNHAVSTSALPLAILFLVATAVALDRGARRLRWTLAGFPGMGLLPVLCAALVTSFVTPERALLLSAWGAVAWPLAGVTHLSLLRWREDLWPPPVVRAWHAAGLVAGLLLLARESAWAVEHLLRMGFAWQLVAWTLAPTLALYLLARASGSRWPLARFRWEYVHAGLGTVAGALALWVLIATFRGDPPAPLPYLPLLHPLELAQGVILAGLWRWWRGVRTGLPYRSFPPGYGPAALGVLAFLALNGVLARTVHAFLGVPFSAEGLLRDRVFHAGLSVLWSLLALGVMVAGSRREVAALWFTGSGLLALVVLKLFLVELSGSGTVARIVSFVAVGLLMLLIGYLAPAPSRGQEGVATPPPLP